MTTLSWTDAGYETDTGVGERLRTLAELNAADYHERFAAAARRHRAAVRRLSNGACVATFGENRPKRLAIMSGLHGDERSGPVALLDWLEQLPEDQVARSGLGVWAAPLMNDAGWNDDTREWTATNLNRAFLPGVAPGFLQEVMDELTRRVPDIYLDLHEDSTRDFAYVYRYTEDRHDLAARLQAFLPASDVPWTPESMTQWKGSSEAFVRRLGCDRSATLEVPPAWNLARRVRWLLRAVNYFLASAG